MQYFVSYFHISAWLASIIQKDFTNNLGMRIVNALSVIYEPDRMGRMARDVSAADWQYQTRKKLNLHSYVQLLLSLGLEIVLKICSLYTKTSCSSVLENT